MRGRGTTGAPRMGGFFSSSFVCPRRAQGLALPESSCTPCTPNYGIQSTE
jgi:hypothetical protein